MMRTLLILALCLGILLGPSVADDAAKPDDRVRLIKQRLKAAGWSDSVVALDKQGRCVVDLGEMQESDLTPLKGAQIDVLSLCNTKVEDLSPLKGMKLTWLNLRGTAVEDLAPLAGMPLAHLIIAGTRVQDISALESMPLTYLEASGAPIRDLRPLRKSPLKTLHLNDTKVEDLRPLHGVALKCLDIDNTPVTDLRPLKEMHLILLGVDPNRIEHGLDAIRKMPSLRALRGGRCSDEFIPVKAFWHRYEHGHPVDNWLADLRAGKGGYKPEPEWDHVELARAKRVRDLLARLGDGDYKVREQAEEALKAEPRTILPLLEKHVEGPDPEVSLRARRIAEHLLADPDKVPQFVFAFERKADIKPDQWREAMGPWRRRIEVAAANAPEAQPTWTPEPVAQSFVPKTDLIAGVDLVISGQHRGGGWLKIELCADADGGPSPLVLARTWLRMEESLLPPHGVWMPIDLPDTRVGPGNTYWLTLTEKRDSGRTIMSCGYSREDAYADGRLLRPAGHVFGQYDLCFRILAKCPPVPLLRRATEEEVKALPEAGEMEVVWGTARGER